MLKYLQALGLLIGLLLIMLLLSPFRSFVFKTDLKKDIKFIFIFWIILSTVFFVVVFFVEQ